MAYIGKVPTAVPLSTNDLADSIVTSAKITDGTIALADLSASGTKDATTFLRGDNTFAEAGGAGGTLSFQAYRSGNLGVSAETQTELVFNAEVTDPSSKYDTSTGRYTPGVAGTYFVKANVTFDPGGNQGASHSMYLKIRKSGSGTTEYGQISFKGTAGQDVGLSTGVVIELGASDYISCWWYNSEQSGNILSVQSWFSGFRLD
jgi:hypothetical protein